MLSSQMTDLYGQFYTTGEPPASLRWERIQTASFDIIFPSGMYEQANLFANRLEYYKQVTTDLKLVSKRRMPVIIQGMSVLSNGYVAWTPDRMEVVPLPPQDSYAQDWLSQLAVHEYRHVAQMQNLRKGFTRGLSFAAGQIATGVTSAMVPPWLYEGDAVLQETRLSATGRGRLAAFEMPLRTLLLTNQRNWSYDKAAFGSFRDFVPNHYQYGYQITGFAQARYGNDIWARAIEYTGRNMFLASPLPYFLKKNYGVSRSALYQQAVDSIRLLYSKQIKLINYTDYSILSKHKVKSYTNDILPQFTDENHIVFLRTSLDHLDRIVMLDNEKNERVLLTTGVTQGVSLSANARFLVWDEIVRDVRWAKRSYSEIRILDLETGRIRPLTRRSRYFSPDISDDGTNVAVVETDTYGYHALVILDAASGDVVKRIRSAGNVEIQTPRWNEGLIVAVTVSDMGKAIYEADPETGTWHTLLANTFYNIAEPLGFNNYVIFRSDFTGIDNLFALNRNTGRIFQITSSRYGAFHPEVSPDLSRIIYSDYTEKGFILVEMGIDTTSWQVVHMENGPSGNWFTSVDDKKDNQGNIKFLPDEKYKYDSQPYYKSEHIFRFHSWLPVYTNVPDVTTLNKIQVFPGFMLFSQNNLETVISTIGYAYSNGNHILKPTIRWSGLYPVFEFSGQIGTYGETGIGGSGNQDFVSGISASNRYEVKTYVPIVFTRGSWIKRIQPLIALQHEDGVFGEGEELFSGIDYMHSKLYLAAYKRLSYRDLYPRAGAELSISGTFTPFNRRQLGDLYSIWANLYFPGIGLHHHLFLYGGWQYQDLKQYYLPINQLNFPRGYPAEVSGSYTSFAVNYAFPVFYPDWSLPPVFYLKRFRANIFFDYGYGRKIKRISSEEVMGFYTAHDASFGTELLMDFHALRFIFPFSAGIRAGYLFSGEEMFASFLISINTNL